METVFLAASQGSHLNSWRCLLWSWEYGTDVAVLCTSQTRMNSRCVPYPPSSHSLAGRVCKVAQCSRTGKVSSCTGKDSTIWQAPGTVCWWCSDAYSLGKAVNAGDARGVRQSLGSGCYLPLKTGGNSVSKSCFYFLFCNQHKIWNEENYIWSALSQREKWAESALSSLPWL